MVFIHLEYLWGLLALAIPVIIHLFDFRKNRKILFPDISFLKNVKHSSRKPLKLKQILILMSRLAFIFFLVMVFAQPIIPINSNTQLDAGMKLVYIDNSQSMSSLVNSKETAMESAKQMSQEIVDQLPNGQQVLIVHNDNLNQFFVPNSLKEAKEKISTITYSDKAFSINQLSLAIQRYNQNSSNLSDIFILSDFQKSSLGNEISTLDTTLTYWLSPILVEETNNCVVDSIYLVESNINGASNYQINAVINNTGSQLKENLPIKVFVGDRQVSAATITILPYQQKSISFSLGKIETSTPSYIQIEDYPNSFDNTFHFSISPRTKLNILEITGTNPSSYIKSVFGNKNLFSFSTNNHQNIDNGLFENANFIVLNQIIDPGFELIEQIKVFASNGGSVLVVPSPNFNLKTYRKLSNLLTNNLEFEKRKLNPPSHTEPFFNTILEKTSRKFEMPSVSSVWGWGKDRSAILMFEDGNPYLSEISNNLFFLSAPLVDSMSNFQAHALFVPVMYGLASQAVSPKDQLFSRIETDNYDVKIDSIEFKQLIKLVKEEMEIITGKTKVGNKWRLTFPKDIINTGAYEVYVEDSIRGHIAINLAKEESQLAALDETELINLFSSYKTNLLQTYNSNKDFLSSFETGIALWKYALAMCLLFLFFETLLIRFL